MLNGEGDDAIRSPSWELCRDLGPDSRHRNGQGQYENERVRIECD